MSKLFKPCDKQLAKKNRSPKAAVFAGMLLNEIA
jgi:hypothetical protein